MTPDEIRNFDGSGYNDTGVVFCMLREIAAQLAELNARLDKAGLNLKNETNAVPTVLFNGEALDVNVRY